MSSKLSVGESSLVIVVSEFNQLIVENLLQGALDAFVHHGGKKSDIRIHRVPGAFEIPGMVKHILDYKKPDLIITLGVLIKGESDHFEYISSSVSNSISQLAITSKIPIIFGILTTHNMEQAIERAYVNKKNKGGEAMSTGLEMLKLYDQYKK